MEHVEVQYDNKTIKVPKGANLRKSLLTNSLSPYNGMAERLNCRGLGSCGTCAVEIEPDPGQLSTMEKWRLSFPPHKKSSHLRLACQVNVHNHLRVKKHKGFWGELKK